MLDTSLVDCGVYTVYSTDLLYPRNVIEIDVGMAYQKDPNKGEKIQK